jgi:hypothetical protein
MDINIQDKNYKKYLKYKLKYLELKQSGGGVQRKLFSIFGNKNIPKFCQKIMFALNICKIYNKRSIFETPKLLEKELKDNLINYLKSDLNKSKSNFDQTKLDNFNTILKDNIEKTLGLYYNFNKNDMNHRNNISNETKKKNLSTILQINKTMKEEINNHLNGMLYKDELSIMINEYFTAAHAYLEQVVSTEEDQLQEEEEYRKSQPYGGMLLVTRNLIFLYKFI